MSVSLDEMVRLFICSFMLLLAIPGSALEMPDPRFEYDSAPFGDIQKDLKAKRQFLKAFSKVYVTNYVREFLVKNKVPNRFPADLTDKILVNIDKLSDGEIQKLDNTGFLTLKAFLDQITANLYQDLAPASKPGNGRGGPNDLVEKERTLIKVLENMDKRLTDAESAGNKRLTAVENAVRDLGGKSNGLVSGSEKYLSYLALALSAISLLLVLKRR